MAMEAQSPNSISCHLPCLQSTTFLLLEFLSDAGDRPSHQLVYYCFGEQSAPQVLLGNVVDWYKPYIACPLH